jgi:hypothetical protein
VCPAQSARIRCRTSQDDAVALARQTIASAARGAPIQLPYKQKIPREPRTRAIAVSATRDRRTAELMLAMMQKNR